MILLQPDHLAEPQPDCLGRQDIVTHFGMLLGEPFARRSPIFQHMQPVRAVDVGAPQLDPVLDGITNDLRRRVKPHRLAVEQGAGEDVGVVALHPARGIDQQRERGGVAFRKTVIAKPLDLGEAALGEIVRISIFLHAAQKPVLEGMDGAIAAERGHGAPQFVGFTRGEAGGDDGDLHRLFLEQRDAFGAMEHGIQLWR